MKTLAYCFSCNLEHDITEIGAKQKGVKCECGGYIISPSGKINMKLIPENNEDEKLLGFTTLEAKKDEIFPKVFKMDDCSWVCAMDAEKAVDWYIETTGLDEDDLQVKECDIDKDTMYSETTISEIIEQLENMSNHDETSLLITRRGGELFVKESFRTVINCMINSYGIESVVKEPFEICSTEW
jgi:hypothetical protein